MFSRSSMVGAWETQLCLASSGLNLNRVFFQRHAGLQATGQHSGSLEGQGLCFFWKGSRIPGHFMEKDHFWGLDLVRSRSHSSSYDIFKHLPQLPPPNPVLILSCSWSDPCLVSKPMQAHKSLMMKCSPTALVFSLQSNWPKATTRICQKNRSSDSALFWRVFCGQFVDRSSMLSAWRMAGGTCAWSSCPNSKEFQRLVAHVILGLPAIIFPLGLVYCIYNLYSNLSCRWKLYF